MKLSTCFIVCSILLRATAGGGENEIELLGKKRARPDVILVGVDTLRADHLGCYGYSRPTSPHVDAFAREGTLFEQCYSPATWTLPAMMSIMTGVLPSIHQVDRIEEVTPLSDSIPTLAEAFHEAGYFCGAVLCNYYARGAYGFYRGFDLFDEYSVFTDTFTSGFDPGLYANYNVIHVRTGRSVMENAAALLRKGKRSGKPIFLFVLFYDPHDEYVAPYEICERYGVNYDDIPIGRGLKDRRHVIPEGRELSSLINLYDSEVAYDDLCFGELLESIDSQCRREDTITIFFSDHGEALGEHGCLLHGNNLHREETHVPMIWRWPGVIAAGHRVRSPVSMLDLARTLGDLFELETMRGGQGETLWPGLLGRQTRADRPVFTERGTATAITLGRYRWHTTGSESLVYDWTDDPLEQTDLIASLEPETLGRFESSYRRYLRDRSRLLAALRERGRGEAEPIELSDEEKQQLKSLGYVQ